MLEVRDDEPLDFQYVMLRATDIVLKFKRRDGSSITALNHVSVEIPDHSRVGLVGESGSGKSTLARVLCGLVKPASGTVEFDGPTPWSRQLISQDSIGALNPRRSVGSTLREVLRIHGIGGVTAESLLERVGLPPELESRRPSELSGGQCQRICIARALALSPTVIIGDEPVSALDVSVQARILRLLSEVTGSGSGDSPALLMITHDLSVVSAVCDYVYVMEKGRIVEQGAVDTVFSSPRHPYTARLLASVPRIAQEAC